MSQLLLKSLDLRHANRYFYIVRNLTSNVGNNIDKKASNEQLYNIEQALLERVPKFFTQAHPSAYYSNEIVFIDNIRGFKTTGLTKYIFRINLIKSYFTIRYSQNSMELLNLVKSPEESLIKVRWRIKSKAVLKTYLGKETWRDGISTFYVDQQGKICSHICDNVQLDAKENLVFKQLKDTLIKS